MNAATKPEETERAFNEARVAFLSKERVQSEPANEDAKQMHGEPIAPARPHKLRRATPADLDDALAADSRLSRLVYFDMFRRRVIVADPLPWDSERRGGAWSDNDGAELQTFLETEHGLLAGLEPVRVAVHKAAHRRRRHPIREYLLALAWDGQPRLDTWLIDCCAAPDTAYVRAVSRKFLVSAVARIMHPGAKVDHMLILEGAQGIAKSTVARTLAGDEYFSDTPPNFNDSRQSAEALNGIWILEFSELSALSRADVAAVKKFLSASEDHYRAAYAHEAESIPRQCVFIGSTNPDATGTYLRDHTGNRRFWPVPVAHCDIGALETIRDQLWAEAVFAYGNKEPWWPTSDEEVARAADEAKGRLEENPWLARTADYIEAHPLCAVRAGDVFEVATNRVATSHDAVELKLIAEAFYQLGYARFHKRIGNWWRPPACGEA